MFRGLVILLIGINLISCSSNKNFVIKDSLFSKIQVINRAIVKDPDAFYKSDSLSGDLFIGVMPGLSKEYFEQSFSFIGEEKMNELYDLLRKDKITLLSLKNTNHISYRLVPKQNNYLLKSEWFEVWLVYDTNNCNKCLSKKGLENPENSIKEIKDNWYRLTIKKKRWIGG